MSDGFIGRSHVEALTWAPEFGGRKLVLTVRDWPSQNGVFGSRGKGTDIIIKCTSLNRKYELILFRGQKIDSGSPQILEPPGPGL